MPKKFDKTWKERCSYVNTLLENDMLRKIDKERLTDVGVVSRSDIIRQLVGLGYSEFMKTKESKVQEGFVD